MSRREYPIVAIVALVGVVVALIVLSSPFVNPWHGWVWFNLYYYGGEGRGVTSSSVEPCRPGLWLLIRSL